MSARVLTISKAVREANLDAKAIERQLREKGHEWGPALEAARQRMLDLAAKPPLELVKCRSER